MPFDIDARIAEWQKSLLDTTKRNRLVKFATGRGGGVELLHPAADALWQRLVVEGRPLTFPWKRDLLGLPADAIDAEPDRREEPAAGLDTDANPAVAGPPGEPVPVGLAAAPDGGPAQAISAAAPDAEPPPRTLRELTEACRESARLGPDHLLTDLSDKKLAGILLRLHRAASEAETDHGVATLYAAFGFLRWYESPDSREELRSPLVLVPVRLARESVEAAWTLQASDDDPAPNHCLAELLAADFRVRLPAGDIDIDGANGLAAYLAAVAAAVRADPRWGVVEAAALGVFNFQKLAMWEDLKQNADRVKAHPLCRAIAGDGAVELRPPPGLPAAAELDEAVPPASATHILDADSSQHEAIEAVKRGADVVIDGPPGTGKSQTIANCVAELLAAGKTVLFVSEKTAALEVVKRRLDARGLGDFCLELHSHKANKREVAAELGRCLDLPPEPYRDVSGELRQLADDRRRLNAYAAELHRPRPPLGLSAFQTHGELARLAELPDRARWTDPDAAARDADFLDRATETLAGLTRCRAVVENPGAHPWRGCRLAAVTQAGLDDARHHLGRLAAGAARLAAGTTLADLAAGGPADTVAGWQAAVRAARAVLAVPPVPPTWLAGDPRAAAAAARALHAATVRCRALGDSLGAFDPAAVRRLEPARAAALAGAVAGPRDRLVGGASLPARERAAAARAAEERLAAAIPVLDRVADAYARLLAALRLPARVGAVGQARKLAQVGAEAATGLPIPPGWWDAARRAEVRAVAARAAEEEAAAAAIRSRLAAPFAPEAFAPEAAAVARDALHRGGSFWRRLSPAWGAVRARVAGWYAGAAPDRATMLADLGVLSEYHRRAGYARQVEAAYAADLVTGPSGRADWAATADGLAAAERYERWKLPAEARAVLAPGGGLDRAGLAAAADDLRRADAEFQAAWTAATTAYAPTDPAAALAATASDLRDRLRAETAAVAAEANGLAELAGLLRDGRDLPPGQCIPRSAELAELADLRRRLAAHAAALALDGTAETVEATDWAELAAAGEGLERFLAATGTPSTAAAAALPGGPARDRLRAAVEASDEVARGGFEDAWGYVAGTLFPAAEPVSDGVVLTRAAVPDVARWAAARLADLHRLDEWVRYRQVRRDAAALGVEAVVDEVCRGEIALDRAADAFRRRFLGLWLDAVYARVPALADFAADDHDARVGRFGRLDRLAVEAAPARLRAALLAHPRRPRADGSAPDTSELGVLVREANKKRRHLPVRRLFAALPTLLPRLKPCVMMSPLAVSTYLGAADLTFDVVIFDEASQVRPPDAVGAVYRGRQLVVAGDPRQLPPSDFFARSTADDPDADDGADGTAGFESLLDVCLSLGLVRKRLRWHYRSRREGLIAFSNRYFYDGGLVTFPGADDAAGPAVRFERVADGRFEDGVNAPEARRAADLVVEHARRRPGESLGVIAFSQRQQNRILDELEARRRAHPELEGFFKEDRPDRFFVKNLENVQGDERDVILLSVGYGPDAAGKVAMRFGPLNREGGERRLNVAVTRARAGMTVVSSLAATDIDLSRTGAEGARLLRAFLEYAERGPAALTEAVTSAAAAGFDSPFEREVCEELRRRGLTVHPQVGCGGFKIDLGIVDRAGGGRYVLGVECDGATYHSSATARDRDRLRQAVLEGLGWRLCRVWSTDWLRNREKQVRRVLDALASAAAPAPPPVAPPPPPDPPAPVAPPAPPPAPPSPTYAKIDDVPELVIRSTALAVVAEYGATEPGDLCRAVARRLGFKRLGGRIEDRIKESLDALARERKLERRDDGRWGAAG